MQNRTEDQYQLRIPDFQNLHIIESRLLQNASVNDADNARMEINRQLKDYESSWRETKIIAFDHYEAHLNCHLDNGAYEIRYVIKEVKRPLIDEGEQFGAVDRI